jgi:hypothetical protein
MTEYQQYQERRRLHLRPDRKALPFAIRALALVNGVAKLQARIDALREQEEDGRASKPGRG